MPIKIDEKYSAQPIDCVNRESKSPHLAKVYEAVNAAVKRDLHVYYRVQTNRKLIKGK